MVKKKELLTAIAILLGFIAILLISIWIRVYPSPVLNIFIPEVEFSDTDHLYIKQDIISILNTRYESDQEEFLYCLYGKNYEDSILIETIKSTKVFEANETYMKYERCQKTNDYLGTIHSHPQGKGYISLCTLSDTDINTFLKDDSLVAGVICGYNKIAVYSNNNLETAYNLRIIK